MLMIMDLHLASNEIRVPPSRNARRVDVTAKYNSLRVRIPLIYWPHLASRHSSRSYYASDCHRLTYCSFDSPDSGTGLPLMFRDHIPFRYVVPIDQLI